MPTEELPSPPNTSEDDSHEQDSRSRIEGVHKETREHLSFLHFNNALAPELEKDLLELCPKDIVLEASLVKTLAESSGLKITPQYKMLAKQPSSFDVEDSQGQVEYLSEWPEGRVEYWIEHIGTGKESEVLYRPVFEPRFLEEIIRSLDIDVMPKTHKLPRGVIELPEPPWIGVQAHDARNLTSLTGYKDEKVIIDAANKFIKNLQETLELE